MPPRSPRGPPSQWPLGMMRPPITKPWQSLWRRPRPGPAATGWDRLGPARGKPCSPLTEAPAGPSQHLPHPPGAGGSAELSPLCVQQLRVPALRALSPGIAPTQGPRAWGCSGALVEKRRGGPQVRSRASASPQPPPGLCDGGAASCPEAIGHAGGAPGSRHGPWRDQPSPQPALAGPSQAALLQCLSSGGGACEGSR